MRYSKLERLAIECQGPEYREPCRAGQKWFCTFDGTRWRKHKCKVRISLYQPGRKCACFRPNGMMYRKIFETDDTDFNSEADNFPPRPVSFKARAKRSTSNATNDKNSALERFKASLERLESIFKTSSIEEVIDDVTKNLKRQKRSDPGMQDNELNEIMDIIKSKLQRIQNINSSMAEANCSSSESGEISCNEAMYQNPKAWKASRDYIEELIKKLKMELDKLKLMRKHLKEKKLQNSYFDEEEDESRLPDDDMNSEDKNESSGPFFNWSPDSTTEMSATNGTVDVDSKPPTKGRNKHRHHHEAVTESLLQVSHKIATLPPTPDGQRNNPKQRGKERTDRVNAPPPVPEKSKLYIPDTCYCEPSLHPYKEEKETTRGLKRRIKDEKQRKKDRKLRRRAKPGNECLSEKKMNCFSHDKTHWKTPPLWTEGPFCFCMNANNNTYSCLRTINSTHNFLYCEFVTGFVSYYNLRLDPFEQTNKIGSLSIAEKSTLHDQLEQLKACRGARQCTLGAPQLPVAYPSIQKPARSRYYSFPLEDGGKAMPGAGGLRGGKNNEHLRQF